MLQEEDIRRRTSAAGINTDAPNLGLGGNSGLGMSVGGDEATQELAAAVESLPKLLEQKKGLEMHTNILKVHAMIMAREKLFWIFAGNALGSHGDIHASKLHDQHRL